ncbi:MAG: phage terminase large subunit family protein [Methylacidiphilales bacterium]|nr:phage terminase large subunit family protein [Candidatus Methylacidiphilales bacterium]
MICPHCDHKFSLGWGTYLKAPFGHHTCPGCLKRFKVILTTSYILLLLGITVIGAAMPAVIAFFLTQNFWYTIATYLVFLFGLVLPFDRWLDDRKKPIKPAP